MPWFRVFWAASHTSNLTTGELISETPSLFQKAVAAVTVVSFMHDYDNYPTNIIPFNHIAF